MALVPTNEQARASPYEILIGGGGGQIYIGTQTHLPPKFSFSSDFGHFIWKMLENAKNVYVSRKKDHAISKFPGGGGGALTQFSKVRGPDTASATPPPPVGDALRAEPTGGGRDAGNAFPPILREGGIKIPTNNHDPSFARSS